MDKEVENKLNYLLGVMRDIEEELQEIEELEEKLIESEEKTRWVFIIVFLILIVFSILT